MVERFTAETIANWASDFAGCDLAKLFPPAVQDAADQVLSALLIGACQHRDIALAEVGEADLRHSLLTVVAKLPLAEAVHAAVPSLCRAYLADLQQRGRLGNGAALGRFVGALVSAYLDASRTSPATFVRPGAKIGRNEPCPCRSGKKYKNCCGR